MNGAREVFTGQTWSSCQWLIRRLALNKEPTRTWTGTYVNIWNKIIVNPNTRGVIVRRTIGELRPLISHSKCRGR